MEKEIQLIEEFTDWKWSGGGVGASNEPIKYKKNVKSIKKERGIDDTKQKERKEKHGKNKMLNKIVKLSDFEPYTDDIVSTTTLFHKASSDA